MSSKISACTNKWNVVDCLVHWDVHEKTYIMKVIYEVETDVDIREHQVRVPLPLRDYPTIATETGFYDKGRTRRMTVDLGFGELHNAEHKTHIIRTKTKDMTLAEIEEKLGHKVKIVKEH